MSRAVRLATNPLPPDAPAHHHVHRHVDEMPFGLRHLKVWLLSAAGLLMGGYSFVSIGVALPLMLHDPDFPITEWEAGAIAAAAVFGRLLGATIFGALVDRFGRKTMYRVDPLILVVFGIATVLAPSPAWMIVFQVAFGMGTGGDYPICSAYVSEVMPKRVRSRMVAGVIACQAVGSVLAVLVGFLLLKSFPDTFTWHWILASVVPMALVVFLLRLRMPESPKWLAEQGRVDEAVVAIKELLGPDAELTIPEGAPPKQAEKTSWSELFAPGMRRRTILTAVPWLCMDIAVYGVGIFTPVILAELHMQGKVTGIDDAFISQRLGNIEGSILVDLFLVVGFAIGISLMAKVTRIRMQILGFLCMAVGLSLIATGSLRGDQMLFIVIGFVIFNTMMNAGPNLSTYTIPTEVFPVRLRASGHGLATGCGKLGATAGVLLFPIVKDHLGIIATLVIVAAFAILGAVVTFLFKVEPDDAFAARE